MSMLKEFKAFAMKGNVIDLSVGIIIGAAFSGIVGSLVNDVLMPVISLFTKGINFSDWFIPLDGSAYKTLAEAKTAGAATLNYGNFITAVINFLLIAFAVFIVIKQFNRFKRPQEAAPVTTKSCPYCMSTIPLGANRCPHCTSNLEEKA